MNRYALAAVLCLAAMSAWSAPIKPTLPLFVYDGVLHTQDTANAGAPIRLAWRKP